MNRLKLLALGVMTLGSAAVALKKLAEERSRAPGRFIDEALSHGIAEIEAAKLALEKSNSVEVKAFAYEMIDDHTAINQHLRQLARNKGHQMDDDSAMVAAAQGMLLKLREATGFDKAYAQAQINSHRKLVTLLNKATNLDDFEVSSFARRTLPRMEHHLTMAQDLHKQLTKGPLKPGASRDAGSQDAGSNEGVWPVDRDNPTVKEPQHGDTPGSGDPYAVASGDSPGGASIKAPAAGEVKQEANPAKPAQGSDAGLSQGSPQQVRGSSNKPQH